jgi:GNAT superfamily N-acetyltransferase
MIDVRNASVDDAELLTVLNRAIQLPHAAMAPECFKQDVDETAAADFYRETIGDEKKQVGIAMLDGEPIGYVLIERVERPGSPFTFGGKRLMVHHLVVVEAARRSGAGTALMHWAEGRAREAGIGRVVLDHMVQNDQARLFYARQGYQALRVTRSKDL